MKIIKHTPAFRFYSDEISSLRPTALFMCVLFFLDQVSIDTAVVLSMAAVPTYRDEVHGGQGAYYDEHDDEGIKYQLVDGVKIRMMWPEENRNWMNEQRSYNDVLPYIAKMVKLCEQGRPPTEEVAIQELQNYLRDNQYFYADKTSEVNFVKRLFRFAGIRLSKQTGTFPESQATISIKESEMCRQFSLISIDDSLH